MAGLQQQSGSWKLTGSQPPQWLRGGRSTPEWCGTLYNSTGVMICNWPWVVEGCPGCVDDERVLLLSVCQQDLGGLRLGCGVFCTLVLVADFGGGLKGLASLGLSVEQWHLLLCYTGLLPIVQPSSGLSLGSPSLLGVLGPILWQHIQVGLSLGFRMLFWLIIVRRRGTKSQGALNLWLLGT